MEKEFLSFLRGEVSRYCTFVLVRMHFCTSSKQVLFCTSTKVLADSVQKYSTSLEFSAKLALKTARETIEGKGEEEGEEEVESCWRSRLGGQILRQYLYFCTKQIN